MAQTTLEMSANRLSFDPTGAHSSGTNIAAATTLTRPTGAGKIMMQALTQNVRYTLDGTAPEAAKGFQLKAGDPPIILALADNAVVKVIEEALSASLQYQWGL